jgi:transposase
MRSGCGSRRCSRRSRRSPRADGRVCRTGAALTGILFVLKTGIPWKYLPAEMGCGSGKTCRRRLRDWCQAGVWRRLHHVLLEELAQADRIDWDRVALDDDVRVVELSGLQRPGDLVSTEDDVGRHCFHADELE